MAATQGHQCTEIFKSYLSEMQNYILRWLHPHQTCDCEKCYFIFSWGGRKNKHELSFCFFSVIPTALRQMGKFPGQQKQLRGGEKNCWSSHGLFSRWCEGSNMICKEIKCMEYLKLLRENYLQESGKFKSQFHRVLNRVVCNEIEFPLEFAWRKWTQCAQKGLKLIIKL